MLNSTLLRLLAIGCALLLCPAAQAQDASAFQEGIHYERVDPPQPTRTGEKLEVLEIFWYGCPHCYDFEPYLEKWKATLPADVAFERLPAVFGDRWLPGAKAYYAHQLLGVSETLHPALFKAIHEQKKPWGEEDEIAAIFAEHGVAESDFRSAYGSEDNEALTRQAVVMSGSYGISGVPSVIINGKYRTSGRQAGGYEQMLAVIDFLLAQERAARAAP